MPNVPSPHKDLFINGINHSLLYLWDAWSYADSEATHLYCLALSRQKTDGTIIEPALRNEYPFHIRHFTSIDDGCSWKDEGCFLAPEIQSKKNSYKTLWSGSIEPLIDGKKLVAYTALNGIDKNYPFLQNIVLAMSNDGFSIDHIAPTPLSSPKRDWHLINEKGYYLAEQEQLGSIHGEGNGPIMAWRDPFIFIDRNNKINLLWSAKVGAKESALAHAIIKRDKEIFKIDELLSPIVLPDGSQFTQAELPKIYYDKSNTVYYLMVSTCNRLYEGQSDSEVDKGIRLYKSNNIRGPWISLGEKILNDYNLFGATVLKADFDKDRLLCIAPYTDAADESKRLTFSPPFYINLNTLSVSFIHE